jgi:hypothetical protein
MTDQEHECTPECNIADGRTHDLTKVYVPSSPSNPYRPNIRTDHFPITDTRSALLSCGVPVADVDAIVSNLSYLGIEMNPANAADMIAPPKELEETPPQSSFTHLITMSVGVDNPGDWGVVYQRFSEMAVEFGPDYPYVSVSSSQTGDEEDQKDQYEVRDDEFDCKGKCELGSTLLRECGPPWCPSNPLRPRKP